MYFNYGYERRLFEQDQAKKRREYRKAGMSEEAIKEMYEYDLYVFNSERKEIKHRAHYSEMLSYDEATGNSHYKDMDEFPCKQPLERVFSCMENWHENVTDPIIYAKMCNLSEMNRKIIFLLINKYTQTEISEIIGISQPAICQRIKVLQKLFS